MTKSIREMPRLTQAERNIAIGMAVSTADCKNLQLQSRRHQQRVEPLSADRPGTRSGRPSVTTPDEDHYIRTIHSLNRFVTATSTAATTLEHPISRRTVLRRHRMAGIRAFRPFRGMALTLLHRQRRLQWARTVRRWQRRDRERVLSSCFGGGVVMV